MDQMRTNDETGEISVRVRQLVFKKDIVVASITELRHFTTSRSGKPDMVGSWNKNWRQTWRKTANGWKLTLMENETKEVKGDGLILTITSPFVKK